MRGCEVAGSQRCPPTVIASRPAAWSGCVADSPPSGRDHWWIVEIERQADTPHLAEDLDQLGHVFIGRLLQTDLFMLVWVIIWKVGPQAVLTVARRSKRVAFSMCRAE